MASNTVKPQTKPIKTMFLFKKRPPRPPLPPDLEPIYSKWVQAELDHAYFKGMIVGGTMLGGGIIVGSMIVHFIIR
jgi:hypothetical protein